jgi:ligand-binding sensor domain-containing protein/signal transduction histidine kinase
LFTVISILFSSECFVLFAQPANLKFTRITAEDGISQSYVVCALQDSRGFMWFGTQDGLNRYDGYNFKVYKHIPNDTTSLSENWIWNIYEDSKGYLWIGTFGGGACRFDRTTETFITYLNDPGNPSSISSNTIWGFYESPDGVLWIAANNGLNQFNIASDSFSLYKPPGKSPNVFKILPYGKNRLLLHTTNELLIFNTEEKTFTSINNNSSFSNKLDVIFTSLIKDTSGNLWAGTRENGLFRFNLEENWLTNFRYNADNPNKSLLNNYVQSIYSDKQNMLWVTTNKGLSLMQFSNQKLLSVQNILNSSDDPNSVSNNYLTNIYESSGGEIWISAHDALNRFDSNNQKFLHYKKSSGKLSSLSHNGVLAILASKKKPGIIWIGTREGLNMFDENNGSFTHFKHNPKNPNGSLSGNYILSLYEDAQGNLWVGTRNEGLCKIVFNGYGEHYTFFRHNPKDTTSLGANNVHYIFEDSNKILWVGTGGGGLNRFNAESNTFTRFTANENIPGSLVDNWVYNIHEDKNGNFWLGTAAGGINLFNRTNNSFKAYRNDPDNPNSLSNNRVLSLLETVSGELWIGTALGLNKLVKPEREGEDFSFKKYYEADGLPNDVIYGMLEDNNGNLWVSTNDGLCEISFFGDSIKIRSYSTADGLQSVEFDQNSFAKGLDGKMYFGGINGFNVFHPDSVKNNPFIPPIVITDFKIINESVPIEKKGILLNENDNSFKLKRSITETDTIILSYKDDMISFEFAALNFTMPEKNLYAYKMEGFDHEWIYSSNRRFVTYTNLDAGEYKFRVKGSNNDGVWNEAGTSITLIITPPPWATWWAYFAYSLVFIGLIFTIIVRREKAITREMEMKLKIEQAKSEERELVRKKSSADFHDEAGNKLTKISLFTELAKGEVKERSKMKEYLEKIEENTKEISSGMRDFIWVLDPAKDSLLDTINRLTDFGNSMFDYTDIKFNVTGLKPMMKKTILSMDFRRSLILIFKEAMNNCLKYSKAKNVELRLKLNDELLEISLIDNGEGFDTSEKSNGYGIKNMRERAEKLNALLEIISTEGKGTSITFKGNITHMGN